MRVVDHRHLHLVPYSQAKPLLRDADLLQFRVKGLNPIGRLISLIGRSPYSHTACVALVNDHVECLEVREFWGGRITDLAWQVEQFGGQIDVFRPSPEYVSTNAEGVTARYFLDTKGVVRTIRPLCRPREYGYLSVLAMAPLIRWCFPMCCDDKVASGYPPYCAEVYAYGIRMNFVDPVPMLPDHRTEPGDLTRSPLLANYLFTLVSDAQGCAQEEEK